MLHNGNQLTSSSRPRCTALIANSAGPRSRSYTSGMIPCSGFVEWRGVGSAQATRGRHHEDVMVEAEKMHREGFALVEWDPGEPLEDLAKGLGLMLREHRLLAPRETGGRPSLSARHGLGAFPLAH